MEWVNLCTILLPVKEEACDPSVTYLFLAWAEFLASPRLGAFLFCLDTECQHQTNFSESSAQHNEMTGLLS